MEMKRWIIHLAGKEHSEGLKFGNTFLQVTFKRQDRYHASLKVNFTQYISGHFMYLCAVFHLKLVSNDNNVSRNNKNGFVLSFTESPKAFKPF